MSTVAIKHLIGEH